MALTYVFWFPRRAAMRLVRRARATPRTRRLWRFLEARLHLFTSRPHLTRQCRGDIVAQKQRLENRLSQHGQRMGDT
jgi:hypothetical protein